MKAKSSEMNSRRLTESPAGPRTETAWVCRILVLALVCFLAGCDSLHKQPSLAVDTLTVRGTPQFCEQVRDALVLLKSKSPSSYAMVTNYVGVIRQYPHSGMRADAKPPCFDLNDLSAFYSLTWCAGVIAHDSYHSKLFHDEKAKQSHPPQTAWSGHAAESKCLAHQVQTLIDIGAPELEIKHCQTITPAYSDVPYRKRQW